MAWQLHYTSAENGPSGRAGFQIVARSPGLPPELDAQVTPYFTYRPPPTTPTAPTGEEIAAMPIAMSYGPAGDRLTLTRCAYLGQDYSGRYGNFLGQAVVADEVELVGVRPVEFWQASLWAGRPAPSGAELPHLDDLLPGTALDPESLGEWLNEHGGLAYEWLGVLLELVRRSLSTGHGRIVLVHPDAGEIVRWIAVISYSLPWETVLRLSFVTYSGDPAANAQLIVGTTPDVWIPADLDATVLQLTGPPEPIEAGRFSTTMRELWRAADFGGIDELADFGPADPETAAAVVALCLAGATLSAEEQSAVAALAAGGLPDWVWPLLGRRADLLDHPLARTVAAHGPAEAAAPCAARCAVLALREPSLQPPGPLTEAFRHRVSEVARAELTSSRDLAHLVGVLRVARECALSLPGAEVEVAVAGLARMGVGDGQALLERVPYGWHEAVFAGLLAGLEAAPRRTREAALTPEFCRDLAGRDLSAAPSLAAAVLAWQVSAGELDRAEASVRILSLGGDGQSAEREASLAAIWSAEPTAAELHRLLQALGKRLEDFYTLAELPGRFFVRAGLKDKDVREVAALTSRAGLRGSTADDAHAVLLAVGMAAERPFARLLADVERLSELSVYAPLREQVLKWAAKQLARHPTEVRIDLLRRGSDRVRHWLLAVWLNPKADRGEQAALLEIAIRLHRHKLVIGVLEEWARALVNSRSRFGALESRFKADRDLWAGVQRLVEPRRRTLLPWWGGR
ncbi:hypothetical protein ACIBHY_40555 [Nonomuraea sp. NPDC050547]|uniref:GAP1-N2 domain-containing protein n=1 Tax=Nonomuraea sp. NPDC050547 TaxID=3364368 RepID=UPI0037BAFA0F